MDMSIILLILIFVAVGILMLYYAYAISIKKDVKVIHEYHYQNMKKEDLYGYLRTLGIGTFIIGATLLIQAGIICIFKSFHLYALFIGLFAGIGIMIYAQYKYNGSMFS